MRRLGSVVIAMCCILSADVSHALELKWYRGGADISVSAAVRCTLVVEADSIEARLPVEWRLLWCADSSGIAFAAPDSASACLAGEAQTSFIRDALTRADSAAHQIIAQFCSDDDSIARVAYQVVDLPAGGKGKLKVVALDPGDVDSLRVIESNEVTFNGGVEGSFPPVILRASSAHESIQLIVQGIGFGLSQADSMTLMAADTSWILPLQVTSKSSAAMFGSDTVAALLPACEVVVESQSGFVALASLAAEVEPSESPQGGCASEYHEGLLFPPPTALGYSIQPKDFAFARGFVNGAGTRFALHLFYIRHNYWYYQPPDSQQHWQPELDEKNIGHIWTDNFNTWEGPGGVNLPDTIALSSAGRDGKFDDFHVWAPYIVQRGPYFHMFYTGVQLDPEAETQHQRIGIATSTDLISWTPGGDAVLTAPDVPWAKKDLTGTQYLGSQQLRDPFLMADPMNPGRWLMYFVAVDSLTSPRMAVGVARSHGPFSQWVADENPIRRTQDPTADGATDRVESPHVFQRHGRWWLPYTVNGDKVHFIATTEADPADTVAAHWSEPIWLRGVTQGEPEALRYWHATEYLRVNQKEYLAAFNDNNISLQISGIFEADDPEADSLMLGCPEVAAVRSPNRVDGGLRMSISRMRPGSADVVLRLELPARTGVKLAIYDIAGRRRSSLLDEELPAGSVDVIWDGRDAAGSPVSSGVYFARLTTGLGAQASKIIVVR